jgi:hypothetical protein
LSICKFGGFSRRAQLRAWVSYGDEERLRNKTYFFLNFLKVKMDPLNVTVHNVAVSKNAIMMLKGDLIYCDTDIKKQPKNCNFSQSTNMELSPGKLLITELLKNFPDTFWSPKIRYRVYKSLLSSAR